MGNVSGNLNTLVSQGGDAMKTVGQGESEISVVAAYILCGFCVIIGLGLIIFGLIPTAPFNCNSNDENNELNVCKSSSTDCTKEQKALDDKKAKCLEKTRKFWPFGVGGIGLILFGIVIVFLSRWNRTLVKNNPNIAAVEGFATTANIIGSMFRR